MMTASPCTPCHRHSDRSAPLLLSPPLRSCVSVCECVCVRESKRDREIECKWVCVWQRKRDRHRESECLCVCVRARVTYLRLSAAGDDGEGVAEGEVGEALEQEEEGGLGE
jgi:hypothetical protein